MINNNFFHFLLNFPIFLLIHHLMGKIYGYFYNLKNFLIQNI